MEQQTQTSQDILYELRDGIGRVTFNRPQARNAFTFAMYERIAEICDDANRDRSIKVLVLQGAGDKAFASGTDINQFRAFTTPQHALEYESRIDRVLTQLEQCRVPTLGLLASTSIMNELFARRLEGPFDGDALSAAHRCRTFCSEQSERAHRTEPV